MTARSTSEAPPHAGRYLPGALTAALVASLPFLVLLVVVPAHIYLGNMQYLDRNQMVILHLGVVYAAIVAILYLLTRGAVPMRKPLAFGLGTVGVIFAVVYLISPSPIGNLIDAGIPSFEEDTSWVLAGIGVLWAAGLALRLIPIAQLMETVAIVCAALGICLENKNYKRSFGVGSGVSNGRAAKGGSLITALGLDGRRCGPTSPERPAYHTRAAGSTVRLTRVR